MKSAFYNIGAYRLCVYSLNTVVVGTGAAGYNAADRLYAYGQRDIAMVTERVVSGTSRNAGSDKQTYYKLALAGSDPDSVYEMAETLFEGGCVDGDLALCEAALSTQCFMKLLELGVPFPQNRYGEYIGYKTDHDPKERATSAGPYTSRMMTECLEASVKSKNIRIFDQMQVIRILSDGKRAFGLLCLNTACVHEPGNAFVLFNCKNIIYATGGPAGMYAGSVYPHGQYGATGLAFEAGIAGKNLTEWQFGIASVHPRWNVSGSYMQALPRMVSIGANGDEREFLSDYFTDTGSLLSAIFLKGYQWPFDARKVRNGSSLIDLLVHLEKKKGRSVFLDFRRNPGGGKIDFAAMTQEARFYLQDRGACFGTPIQRLAQINQPAVDFYMDKGVNLHTDMLEIDVCVQHNNGGLGVDCWWHTNVDGFFAVGEASASHGVYRPGGSALNAGQAGGMRAARYIARRRNENPVGIKDFRELIAEQVTEILNMADVLQANMNTGESTEEPGGTLWDYAAARMSRTAGIMRDMQSIRNALRSTRKELAAFPNALRLYERQGLSQAFRLRDILLSQEVYLSAMEDYMACGGESRGSALYLGVSGIKPHDKMPDSLRFLMKDSDGHKRLVQEVMRSHGINTFVWRKVRPIPDGNSVFEMVWREFQSNGNVY